MIPTVVPWSRLPVPGSSPMYVPDGLVYDALSLTDDDGVYLRRFHAFRAAIGEFELAAILYVLCKKSYSEQLELSA